MAWRQFRSRSSDPERHVPSISRGSFGRSAGTGASDFRGLARVRDALGARFKAGVVLYTSPNTVRFGDRLTAILLEGLWAASTSASSR